MKNARRLTTSLAASVTAIFALTRTAWAFEETLSSSNPAAGLGVGPGSTFTFAAASVSVVRLLAVVFAFFMAAMAVHGCFLLQQNSASMDEYKKSMGVLKQGVTGTAVALIIAAAAKPLAAAMGIVS